MIDGSVAFSISAVLLNSSISGGYAFDFVTTMSAAEAGLAASSMGWAQPHQLVVVTDVFKGDQADAGNDTIGLMAELERLVIVHATGDFRAILAEGPGCTIHLCCTGE